MAADFSYIAAFAQKLVRTPSQAGIDDCTAIVETAAEYARDLGLPVVTVPDDAGKPVALVAEIRGGHPGKTWAVNATLDTAPVGDLSQWKEDPFSGAIRDGFLYGRGAADSKLAAALFMHLAKDLQERQENMHGNFLLILDADEHTGNFGGIKAALNAGFKPDGIMIGYPGDDKIVVGSRGFSRYEIVLTGKGAHSGASLPAQDNPLVRIADIVQALSANQPVTEADPEFDKQPKVTVTQIEGGGGFSVVPTQALARVDVRLTPAFNEAAADRHIRNIVAQHDLNHQVPEARASVVNKVSSEPAFLTPELAELRKAMREAVLEITGTALPEFIAGPSNIGNHLARQGIEVTAGYGVPAKGVHAPDERANLRPLPKIYDVYRKALQKLLQT